MQLVVVRRAPRRAAPARWRFERPQQRRVDAGLQRAHDRHLRLDRAQPRLQRRELRRGDAVDLVQHQQVGGRHLLLEELVEIAQLGELLGVHQHHGHVVADPLRDGRAPQRELRLVGQRQPRRLDDDAIRRDVAADRFERFHQLVRQLAADAAARELDAARVPGAQQRAVDAERAEVVHHDGEALADRLRLGEQRADERRLARTEKARDDERGNALRCGGFHVQGDGGERASYGMARPKSTARGP